MLLGAFAAWVFRLGKNQIVTIGIGKKFGQCEVSDQIQNKRSDQIFKREFKNDTTVYRSKLKANK